MDATPQSKNLKGCPRGAGFHGWRCPTIQTPKLTLEVALLETNTSHLPGSRAPKGNDPLVFQPSIFQVRKC